MKYSYLIILVVILLLVFCCERDSPDDLPIDLLSFWEFEGYDFNGNIEEIPDTINIDLYIGSIYSRGNDFEGESSFRNYWGRFILDYDRISFYDLRVTDIMTYEDSILYYDIERKYLNTLMKSERYIVEDDLLTIFLNSDSSLIFKKNANSIYSDKYELSALYDGQEWAADSNSIGAGLDYNYYSHLYSFSLFGEPIKINSDGHYYDLGISIASPPKTGTYYEGNSESSIHAYSFIDGDPNANRSESSAGYLKINRVSRRFIAGEFEFHMVQSSKEFEITKGRFKAKVSNSSGLQWYIEYK